VASLFACIAIILVSSLTLVFRRRMFDIHARVSSRIFGSDSVSDLDTPEGQSTLYIQLTAIPVVMLVGALIGLVVTLAR
jgi:hypothetical protein